MMIEVEDILKGFITLASTEIPKYAERVQQFSELTSDIQDLFDLAITSLKAEEQVFRMY